MSSEPTTPKAREAAGEVDDSTVLPMYRDSRTPEKLEQRTSDVDEKADKANADTDQDGNVLAEEKRDLDAEEAGTDENSNRWSASQIYSRYKALFHVRNALFHLPERRRLNSSA